MGRGTCGRHTPPAPFLLSLGQSNEDAVPQKEGWASPETRDVYNHKAPTGVGVDIIIIGRCCEARRHG